MHAAILVVAIGALVLAAPAMAGQSAKVEFSNATSIGLRLTSYDNYCMYPYRLTSGVVANPGGTTRFSVEDVEGIFTRCRYDTSGGLHYLDFNLEVLDTFGNFLRTAITGMRLYYDVDATERQRAFGFQSLVPTWVPMGDQLFQPRGLVCVGVTGDGDAIAIRAFDDQQCVAPRPTAVNGLGPFGEGRRRRAAFDRGKAPAAAERHAARDAQRAESAQSSGFGGPIADLLPLSRFGCAGRLGWTQAELDADRGECSSLADPGKWTFDDLYARADPPTLASGQVIPTALQVACAEDLDNKNASGTPPQTLSCADTIQRKDTRTTTTTSSSRFGARTPPAWSESLQVGGGAALGFQGDWSTTAPQGPSVSSPWAISQTAEAAPGYDTHLDVLVAERKGTFSYDAVQSFGGSDDGDPEADTVDSWGVSPAPSALAMSPAETHQCLTYIVGDQNVPNSLLNVAKQLGDSGKSDPTQAYVNAFLQTMPSFTIGSGGCPDFPTAGQTFASRVFFSATGSGVVDQLGVNPDGTPNSALIQCVWRTPNDPTDPSTPADPPAGGGSPCSGDPDDRPAALSLAAAAPSGGAAVARTATATAAQLVRRGGVLVEAETSDRRVVLRGASSHKVVAAGVKGQRIEAGEGAFDYLVGSGAGEELHGQGGTDLIQAGGGGDLLRGGPGRDQLAGGGGDDRIADEGEGVVDAGSGDDRVTVSGLSGRVDGGQGDDRIAVKSVDGPASVAGGPGDDVYESDWHAGVTELPGEGTDVLISRESMTLPAGVEVGRAAGRWPLTLRGGPDAETLVGNAGANRIEAGIGSQDVRGGDGADRILMTPDGGLDRVKGQGGADRFVPLGTPVLQRRSAALNDPDGPRSAHELLDFDADEGDRIVLSSRVFGQEVTSRLIAFERDLRPSTSRPTIGIDRRSRVVVFDRDGKGPLSDKVVVKLPRETARALTLADFERR